MTFSSIVSLFGVMVVLAAIPSISVLTVTSRALEGGFKQGAFAAFGIVVGDIIFILIAIFGLTILMEKLGDLFIFIKFLGGAYLIWLGTSLMRSRSVNRNCEEIEKISLLSSFLSGLLVTLGDQKAILFYLVFFPAFIDLEKITQIEIGIILLVSVTAVGGVKLIYAFLAAKASLIVNNTIAVRAINAIAGTILISIGILLILRSWVDQV